MEERLRYLFRQYLGNKCSRKEFDEFFAYMREAAHDETIRALIKKVYDDTGHASLTYVDECGNLVLPEPEWFAKPATPPVNRKKRKRSLVVIASCTLIGAVAIWLMTQPANKTATAAVTTLTKKATERSEYRYLLLPDSTQVWLNAASTLEFPPVFNKDTREVFLVGEAYFDVKHTDKIPFIIHTGKVSTSVLGTAFNIKAYPGLKNIVVSVSRGKVRVNYENREVATLTKGQQVKVSNTDNGAAEKKTTTKQVAAWQQGDLVYDDETMQDILSDLERIYNVTIRVTHTAVSDMRVSTAFKREIGVEQALQVLCRLTDTELKRQEGTYIIQ